MLDQNQYLSGIIKDVCHKNESYDIYLVLGAQKPCLFQTALVYSFSGNHVLGLTIDFIIILLCVKHLQILKK